MKLLISSALLLISLSLSACFTTKGMVDKKSLGGEWVLAYFNESGNDKAVEEGTKMAEINIGSDLKKFSGNGGCNRIGGTLKTRGSTLTFSNVISTKMACDVLNVENQFLQKLNATTHYEIAGDLLLLKNKSEILMTLKRKTP